MTGVTVAGAQEASRAVMSKQESRIREVGRVLDMWAILPVERKKRVRMSEKKVRGMDF